MQDSSFNPWWANMQTGFDLRTEGRTYGKDNIFDLSKFVILKSYDPMQSKVSILTVMGE